MPSSDKDFLDRLSNILSLLFSIVAIISAFVYSRTEIKSRWWVYAVAIAIIVLIWAFHRRYKRRRLFNRVILQRSNEGKPVGFNGALAYTQDDRDRFFGRENDIVPFLAQIKQDDYHYGVLFGESGVGKTSFIQAGIIPRMGKDYQCVYISLNNLPRYDIKTPSKNLDIDLISYFLIQAKKKLHSTIPFESYEELKRNLSSTKTRAIIFFLDQFEQIFDHIPEKNRIQFARAIRNYSRSDFSIKFVISIRSDYFGNVFQMLELDKRSVYCLHRFNEPQVKEIIQNTYGKLEISNENKSKHPLQSFEEEIINDLQDNDGYIHPVEISLICWIMLRTSGELTREKYIDGGRKQGWLDRYLDDVLHTLPNKQQGLQILRSLISGDKSEILSAKEISSRSGISYIEAQKMLINLEQSKLIIKEGTGDE